MRRAVVQARWEFSLLIRNGEQALLTLVIPVALLLAVRALGRTTIAEAVPAIMAVSLLATCFTSLAIATGFERRSGAIRYAAVTPLTRIELLLGKLMATTGLAIVSLIVVAVIGVAIGWRPAGTWPLALPFVIIGGAAFAAWGVLLAGILRAEAVLAVANGLFVLLIAFGGVLIAPSAMPTPIAVVVGLLPTAAVADGLRATLATSAMPWSDLIVLVIWLLAGTLIARRTFRWD